MLRAAGSRMDGHGWLDEGPAAVRAEARELTYVSHGACFLLFPLHILLYPPCSLWPSTQVVSADRRLSRPLPRICPPCPCCESTTLVLMPTLSRLVLFLPLLATPTPAPPPPLFPYPTSTQHPTYDNDNDGLALPCCIPISRWHPYYPPHVAWIYGGGRSYLFLNFSSFCII